MYNQADRVEFHLVKIISFFSTKLVFPMVVQSILYVSEIIVKTDFVLTTEKALAKL